jgi:hypothetical protein
MIDISPALDEPGGQVVIYLSARGMCSSVRFFSMPWD